MLPRFSGTFTKDLQRPQYSSLTKVGKLSKCAELLASRNLFMLFAWMLRSSWVILYSSIMESTVVFLTL